MQMSRCFPPYSLLRELEHYYGCKVTAASFFEAEDACSQMPAGWAQGDYIVLPKGLLSPLRAEGIFFLAHEACHLRRQAEHRYLSCSEAELEADFYAALFTYRYLKGLPCTPMPKVLPLAGFASVPAMAWGLGGLFSLKQYVADGYTKKKGYAYFYQGPHEWLTEEAAHKNNPKEQNYVTKVNAVIDEASLILGSEMNDMYILPEKIKEWFDEDVLRKIGKEFEQSDFASPGDFEFDGSAISETVDYVKNDIIAGLFDNNFAVLSHISNIDFSFVLWYTFFSNFLRTSRLFSVLIEKQKHINEKIGEVFKKQKEWVSDHKKDWLRYIWGLVYESGVSKEWMPDWIRFGFSLLFMEIPPIDSGIDFLHSVVEALVYKDPTKVPLISLLAECIPSIKEKFNADLDPAKKEWYEKRLKDKTGNLKYANEAEKKWIETITLYEIWWVEEESVFADIEAFFSGSIRKLLEWAERAKKEGIKFSDYVGQRIDDFFDNLQIPQMEEVEIGIPEPWINFNITCEDYYCTIAAEAGIRERRISLAELSRTINDAGMTVKDFILRPVSKIILSAVKDAITELLETLVSMLEDLRGYYNTILFLLGSHTGELQFLHSMDCSRGSVEWNREKMIRWCEFCYDCKKVNKGDALLDRNIFEYLDELVPMYFFSGESKAQNSPEEASEEEETVNPGRYLTKCADAVNASLPKYRRYFKEHEKDLLLASMLLPLCCIRMQLNNCQIAARRVCNIEIDDETVLSREQAREYDLCLVIAMKLSLHMDFEDRDNDAPSTVPRGKYRTPITDMTFRQFFTGGRKDRSASDILLGMAMHMIEDSFTPSHTIRSWNTKPGTGAAPIIAFADYTKQEASRHACADYFVDYSGALPIDDPEESKQMEVGDVDEPDMMSINQLDGADMMSVGYSDGTDMMSINYSPKEALKEPETGKGKPGPETKPAAEKERKVQTPEDLRRKLPFYAAQETVGAESALHFAQEYLEYVRNEAGDLNLRFSRDKIVKIYPLLKEKLSAYNKEAKKEQRVEEEDRETPASGRCYEMESLEKETSYSEKRESLTEGHGQNKRLKKYEKRYDKLNETIEDYRKYLLEHFAKNLYPNTKALEYYEEHIEKEQRDTGERIIKLAEKIWDTETKEYWGREIGKPRSPVKEEPYRTQAVLEMYLRNDIPFLRDILTSELLSREVCKEYEEKAEELGNNSARSLVEETEKVHKRYMRHLNELILIAAGVHEQTKDGSTKERAKNVIAEAKRIKKVANRHRSDEPSWFLKMVLERLGERVKKRDDKNVRICIFYIASGFNEYTIAALLRGMLEAKNPEKFQQNAGIMLDVLEKLLKENYGDEDTISKIKTLREEYVWLAAGSFEPSVISADADDFCKKLAKIIKGSSCLSRRNWWPMMTLPEGLEEFLKAVRENYPEFYDEDESEDSVSGKGSTFSSGSTGLFESYLAKARDMAKDGKIYSDFAEEWFGKGYYPEYIEKMGRNLLKSMQR